MSGKKACVNCSTAYYTGKEQSPLHFGLSAEGYEINSIMEGFDKELWIVELRNSKKVWTKKEHINKMTYEIPLINEFTDTTEVSKNEAGKSDETAGQVVDTVTVCTAATAVETANTNSDISVNATANATAATAATANASVINETDSNEDTATNAKVSKKIKPTDYTLFITYRIHQMKLTSTDNKKNYDCAREEWKEYKKTPDKLRDIMIEANNFNCASK